MNHKGFSIIEMVFVIAILSVITGGLVFGLEVINKADSEKGAAMINSALAKLRMESMSKERQFCLTISKDSDGYYRLDFYRSNAAGNAWEEYAESKKVGSRYTIEYTPASVDSQNVDFGTVGICDSTVELTGTSSMLIEDVPIIIRFDKESGKVKNGAGEYKVSGGSRSYVVKLIELTGAHFYE